MNARESVQYLTNKLKSLRNHILIGHLARGTAIFLTVLAMALIVAFLFHVTFFLSTTFRMVFLIIAAVILALALGYNIFWRFFNRPSTEDVALDVEQTNPNLKNHLIASLQLESNLQENREGYSTEMIGAVIAQSQKLCEGIDFKKSVDKAPLHQALRFVAVAAVVVIAVWFLFPSPFNESLYLFSHPFVEIERQLSYDLEVLPGNAEVAKFSAVAIKAALSGTRLPQEATLHWRYPAGKVKSMALLRDDQLPAVTTLGAKLGLRDTTRFAMTIREVRKTFEYWVKAGEITSPVYTIIAVDKPRIIGLKLTYYYPKYTGLKPLVIDENDGNISAIKGTRVKIEAAVNKEVEKASLIYNSGGSGELEIDKQKLTGSIKVFDNGSYHIAAVDAIGNENENPIEYRIEKIADLYPELNIFSPGVPIDLDDEMMLPLGVRLFDDFGFTKINLIYQVFSPYGENFGAKESLEFDRSQRDFELHYNWDLSNVGLEPGGYVEYYVEGWDNDAVSGPKQGVSQVLTARLPTLDEMFAYLEEEGEEQISELERVRQMQEELAEKTRELQEDLLFNQDLDWEQRQEAQQALDLQKELMNAIEKVAKRMEQMADEMRHNDLTSLEILQKLQQIQELFEQVATPEMKESMRKMQEALEKMDPQELQRAAEEMELSQEELKERLERTIELLKFMQLQQKMENMMNALEQIIEKQEQVNQETEESEKEDLSSLAPNELENKNQFDKLKKQAEELTEMFKDLNLFGNKSAQRFCEAPSQSDAGEKMQKMAGDMNRSDKPGSMQKGEEALASLNKLRDQMSDLKNEMNSSMGMQSAEDMKEAANEVLYVSEQQENVYGQCNRLNPRSPSLRQQAAEQQAIQKTLETLDQRLREISKESAFYEDAINSWIKQSRRAMEHSVNSLSNRNGTESMRHQKESMFALNQAANQLLQSMQNQKECSGGSCSKENLFKKMGKLSEQQMQINNRSKQMCQNPRPGKEGKQMMSRLAGEQQAIQKSLGQLKQEQGNRPNMLGRLDELANEARKIVEDIEGGTLDDNTTRRQHKILSRMLDFQRSLERQDFSEERRAERGRDIRHKSPAELLFDNAGGKKTYQDRLQKYLEEEFPEEYEELVKEYFRAVNSKQQN